jgi:hypothetical protein
MFNRKLRQRISELEDKLNSITPLLTLEQSISKELNNRLEKASTYHDGSDYECPLCGRIDAKTKIPIKYCSLHLQIAKQEKAHNELFEVAQSTSIEGIRRIRILVEIINEHRETIDKIMLRSADKPFKLSQNQSELLAAALSESELKIQSLCRTIDCGDWLYALTYVDKM